MCFICGTLFLPNVSFAALGSTYGDGGISAGDITECKVKNGEGTNDNEVLLAKGKKKHFMCGDGECYYGALVGIIGTGVIKYHNEKHTDAWFECITGFDDYWEHFGKIEVCTTDDLLFDDSLIVNSGDNTDKVLIDEDNSRILREGYVVANDSHVRRYNSHYCLAYQCKYGKIANKDKTQCINACTEGAEEPAECPSNFTDATTCVKTCVSGKWKTLISKCKDNYSISTNRIYCTKQPSMNSKSGSPTPDAPPAPLNSSSAKTVKSPDTTTQQAETQSSTTLAASSGDCNTPKEREDRGAVEIKKQGALCVATKCKPDHYKVKDASGAYHGWCIYISCPNDQEPNIDAQEMWDQTTDKCRARSTSTVAVDPAKTVVEETGGTEKTSGDAAEASVATSAATPADPADGEECTKPGARQAEYRNGKCIAMECDDGYERSGDNCVKISGPCKSLPAHAVRGHREYNADTGDTECIIEDCDDGYVVADDKLSCHEDYESLAEEAREREQSMGNKLIGALGMGATGIGGSMLMSGLAESNADDDAERAMAAYLETFTCKYGNESVSGGTMNVEIPGGNELINMYSEYVALANDLKLRKAALGMKPGIESEPILDSATSGLYDDVGTGRGKGAYASLARALENPDGEDAKAWAAQREEAQKKTKTGAITAGVGAGASLIGNIAINGGKDNEDNEE